MSGVPLRIIIGFSPGSMSDDVIALIATPLGEVLDRPVLIERIAGDNGARGAAEAARAVADGSTLYVATLGTHGLAPHMRKDLPYDAINDFAPITLLTQSPMLLAGTPALPVVHVQGLIAHAHAHPGVLTYGTSALGGAPHLAAELFQSVTGVRMRHVRYDETQKLYADLEAGTIALSFNNVMSMLPRCSAGRLRALAVTSTTRLHVAPEVPTFAECGVRDCEMSNWCGLVAPSGTPGAMMAAIANAAAAVMRGDAVSSKLEAAGITPCGSSPTEFAQFISAELNRWKPVVARFGKA